MLVPARPRPAPGGGTVAPAAVAPPAAPLKARSAFTTVAASVSPFWVAQEGGYFREQGLDVELLHTDAGATLLAALTNGELDMVSRRRHQPGAGLLAGRGDSDHRVHGEPARLQHLRSRR